MVKTTQKKVKGDVALTAPKKPSADALPAPEPVVEEPEWTGSVSLGTNSKKAVGRNKCGMAWKKESKRSSFSKGPPIAYLKSMEEKERLKRIRERVANLREDRKTDKQEIRRRLREKAKQKELNEWRSSTYQVVSSQQPSHIRPCYTHDPLLLDQ